MKIVVVNGVVTATSQTRKEARALIDLTLNSGGVEKVERRHKKHQYRKKCEYCHREYRGNIGLGIHRAKCKKQQATHSSSLVVDFSKTNSAFKPLTLKEQVIN